MLKNIQYDENMITNMSYIQEIVYIFNVFLRLMDKFSVKDGVVVKDDDIYIDESTEISKQQF